MGLATLADLGRRDIPTYFLDIRERVITTDRDHDDSIAFITKLAHESNAFPHVAKENLWKYKKSSDGTIAMMSKRELLNVVFGMIESQVSTMTSYNIRDDYDSSAIALVHAALIFTSNSRIDQLLPFELRRAHGKCLRPEEMT